MDGRNDGRRHGTSVKRVWGEMEKFDSIFWNVLICTNIPPKKSWYYVKFGFNVADSVSTVPMVQKKETKECHFGIKKEK